MTEIARSYGGHCVERAVSTMRIALGYETGLPDNWPDGADKSTSGTIKLFNLAFPDREMLVWCREEYYVPSQNSMYLGSDMSPEPRWDDYLFSFVYGDGNGNGHMVIGHPAVYGEMTISLIIAIAIRKVE